ncbi:SAM-dependent methyltransferase [Desulfovibrio cuneatus]|uniref:SAM-dependent methyltransferase n=1 Tax=Desulfovibrio cuneatus TaxID=159728 RepID=UPI000429B376|nr:SAM-dependent methyltransferase [Desulfovibrio cuneatus]
MPHNQYAKAQFPCGLAQPQGSFRFSQDALLLAAFASLFWREGAEPAQADEGGEGPVVQPPRSPLLLDIGTGCGVVALRHLLHFPAAHAMGLEFQPELLEAAVANAHTLGVGERFVPLLGNVHDFSPLSPGHPLPEFAQSCALVVANPPYRLYGHGRIPASPLREKALFGTEGTLPAFCQVAAMALQQEGVLCVVFPAAGLARLQGALHGAGLGITHTMHVYSRAGEPAQLVLVAATKGAGGVGPASSAGTGGSGGTALTRLPDLVVHQGTGRESCLTKAVLAFCPELARNRGNGAVVHDNGSDA